MSGALKLAAEDEADLQIIGAAAQDALVRMKDVTLNKRARRFTALLSRFRWERAGKHGPYQRIRSALSFEGVLAVKSRRVRADDRESLASILSIEFVPDGEPPGGQVRLLLAGGGEIALQVECLDALLIDMGDPWPTPRRPDHERSG